MHISSGWEIPRIGGACETNGPPCQIRRSHPRVGHYATGLLGAGYSPDVVTCGSASLTYRRSISSPSSSRTPSSPHLPAVAWVTAHPTDLNEQKRCAIPSPHVNHVP